MDAKAASSIPQEANQLHQAAREAGGRGDYKLSLNLLAKASALAPCWPYPHYDAAWTFVLQKDFNSAATSYRKTVELSPGGFLNALMAVWCLEREEKGIFPVGIYLQFALLEWEDDKSKKCNALHKIVKECPAFAPAWSALASLQTNDEERLKMMEKCLSCDPDLQTRGSVLVNKALALSRQKNNAEAKEIIKNLLEDKKTPTSVMASATLVHGML